MTKRERILPILLLAFAMLFALLLIITVLSVPAFGQMPASPPGARSAEGHDTAHWK